MSKCINEKIASMVHAYELGMLNEEDSSTVEVHLLECPKCHERFLELVEASQKLRSDPEIRAVLETLSDEKSKKDASDRTVTGNETSRRTTIIRFLAVAAAAIIILVLKPWSIRFESDDPVRASGNMIAIMPFESLLTPADTSRLAEIAANLLMTDLSESKYLEVVPGMQVVNASEYLRSKDVSLDSAMGERAALERFGVGWILNGSVLQMEPQIVLTIRITDVSGEKTVESLRETGGTGEGVFAVIDRLSARIREGLLTPLEVQKEFDPTLAEVTTQSAEAYRWYLDGVDLYGRKHFEEAEDCYRRAVGYDSTFAMGWYCLAFHGVPNALENAVRFSDRATYKEKLYIYSLDASYKGDDAEAEALMKELVERYPNEKIAWMELAWMARENMQYDDAVHYLQQSLQADPLYIDALDLLAYVYNEMGDYEQALVTIEETITLEPEEPNPYDSKGELLAANGRLDDAVVNYERVVSIKPDFLGYQSMVKLGCLYVYQGRYEEARTTLQGAITGGDTDVRSRARTLLPQILLYQGKVARAEIEMDDALAADRIDNIQAVAPASAAVKFFVLSRLRLAQDDAAGAASALAEALPLAEKAGPYFRDAYAVYYAHAMALSGDSAGARKEIEELKARVPEQDTNLDRTHKAQGLVAFAQGRYARAVEHLTKIVGAEWLGFDTRYILARSLLYLEQYKEAADEFRSLLDNYSDTRRLTNAIWAVESYFYLASAEEQLGYENRAVEHYEQFLDIWADADSTLVLVRDAKERLTHLGAGS